MALVSTSPSPTTQSTVDAVIDLGWRDSTLRSYSTAIKAYLKFVTEAGVPLAEAFPAAEELLCRFVASLAGAMAGRTIGGMISGVRAWHIRANLPWNGRDRLRYALKGAETLRPPSSYRPPRFPVTPDMLRFLARSIDHFDPFDACVLAIALTAFWGQLRLGEILPRSASSLRSTLLPSWSSFRSANSAGSRVLHLPVTKTKGAAGEDVMITRQGALVDPIAALSAHSRLSGNSLADNIATFRSTDGFKSMTYRPFIKRVNFLLSQGHFPTISGHSFRIGGTTALLIAGVPPDVVKSLGRWSSDSFLRYWRSVDVLGPAYVENLDYR